MGLFDRLFGNDDDRGVVDRVTKKIPGGFDADVCTGEATGFTTECPYNGQGKYAVSDLQCGLCGCPNYENGTLDKKQVTPEGCPREAAHKRRD